MPRSVDPHQWAIAKRKQSVRQALTTVWQSADEVSRLTGLTLQCTCRLLDGLARDGQAERDWNSWRDGKGRNRGNWLYRLPVKTDWGIYPKWLAMQVVK